MSLCTYEEESTDDADLHVDKGGEITTVEIDGQLYEQVNGLLKEAESALKIKVGTRVTLICSCGSRTCGMLSRYGHPEPIFSSVIEPIPSQMARDAKALALK